MGLKSCLLFIGSGCVLRVGGCSAGWKDFLTIYIFFFIGQWRNLKTQNSWADDQSGINSCKLFLCAIHDDFETFQICSWAWRKAEDFGKCYAGRKFVFHSALKIRGGWKLAINNLVLKASIKTENKKIWSQLKTQIKHFHSFNIQT